MRHWAIWIAAAVLMLFIATPAPCAEPPKLSAAALDGAFREYEKLAEKYGIEIEIVTPTFDAHGRITGQPPDPRKAATFLAHFKNEWSFYPVELMPISGLKRVTLCEELFSDGRNVGGLARGDRLYVDVGESRHSKLYVRTLIHHEFFHILDIAMHRKVGVRHALPDKIWEGLNAPGFKYDPGIFGQPGNTKLDLTQKGFLNRYQQTAVQEDKADIYAYMVTMGQIVDERAKIDPVIDAKVKRMKHLVKAFCPQMDDEFWKAARKVSRPGG